MKHSACRGPRRKKPSAICPSGLSAADRVWGVISASSPAAACAPSSYAGDLLFDEAVVRLVLIERIDYIVHTAGVRELRIPS